MERQQTIKNFDQSAEQETEQKSIQLSPEIERPAKAIFEEQKEAEVKERPLALEAEKEKPSVPETVELPKMVELEPNLTVELKTLQQVEDEAKEKIKKVEKQDASLGKVAREAKKILDEEKRKYLGLAAQ